MTDQGPPAAASQSWRTVAVVSLVALALVLGGLGVTVGLLLGDDDGDGDAAGDAAGGAPATTASTPTASDSPTADETPSPDSSEPTIPADFAEVVGASSQFVTTVNTYGPTMLEADGTMPTYRSAVGDLLTDAFRVEFLENVPTAEASVKEVGLSRTTNIAASGLSIVDDDAATALVSGTVTSSFTGNAGDEAPFRSIIRLQRVDGAWLVDDFTTVDGSAQELGAGLGAGLGVPRATASRALETILAYDYRDMDAERARPLMTDAYWEDYEKLFEVLADSAPEQQAVVTARSLATAVAEVGDGYVDVLVFVDRESTTLPNGRRQYRDAVTARMVPGPDGWLVDKVTSVTSVDP